RFPCDRAEPGRSESRHLGGSAQQAAVAQIEAEHARRRRRPFPRPHHSGQVARVPEGLRADDDRRRAYIARLLDRGGGGGPGRETPGALSDRWPTTGPSRLGGAMIRVIGWDIGGANVKAAHVLREGNATSVETISRPFEIWKDPTGLAKTLRTVAADLPEAEA